jgi:hypothetical protein
VGGGMQLKRTETQKGDKGWIKRKKATNIRGQ